MADALVKHVEEGVKMVSNSNYPKTAAENWQAYKLTPAFPVYKLPEGQQAKLEG